MAEVYVLEQEIKSLKLQLRQSEGSKEFELIMAKDTLDNFIKDIASLLDNNELDENCSEYTCEDILAGIRILKQNKELAQENVLKGYKRYADLVKKNNKS
jgi:hypothetical protein